VWDSDRIADETKVSRLDTWMPALIGAAGVIAGVLVTAGIQWLGDHSRRMADERAAERLISKEIARDTNTFIAFSEYGRLSGPLPQDGEWIAEAPVLARYASSSTWDAVSKFYANVLSTEQSLTTTCPKSLTKSEKAIAVNGRNEIRTDALLGGEAFTALTGLPLDTSKRKLTESCYITGPAR
jgi:hypothetical protein